MGTPKVGDLGVIEAVGDLVTQDAVGDAERLPVGVDGEFLSADSAEALGLKWRKITEGDLPNRYRWFGITSNAETDDGSYATVEVGQNSSINCTFHFPDDFATLVALEVFFIPLSTVVDVSIELYSNYAGLGENKAANAQSDLAQLFSFTADDMTSIDISSLYTNADPDDAAGIMLDHQSINSSIRYLGVHMSYTPG